MVDFVLAGSVAERSIGVCVSATYPGSQLHAAWNSRHHGLSFSFSCVADASCQIWWFTYTHAHTHTRLMALCPGLPGWAGTRKAKPIWILLKQETVSGSGISWAICKSAPSSRQITMPAPHHSVFYRPDALPAAQPTSSKHWRPSTDGSQINI